MATSGHFCTLAEQRTKLAAVAEQAQLLEKPVRH